MAFLQCPAGGILNFADLLQCGACKTGDPETKRPIVSVGRCANKTLLIVSLFKDHFRGALYVSAPLFRVCSQQNNDHTGDQDGMRRRFARGG